MNVLWQALAEGLRTEVAEYGRLVQIFEEQQVHLLKREAADVLRTTNEIDQQVRIVAESRRAREDTTRGFARSQGFSEDSTIRSLMPAIPAEARPLIAALVEDLNRLVRRVRRISRHNRLFLIRTIETHQELLRRFRPGSFTKTYSNAGNVTVAPFPRASAFAAEG
jgi:flagellar biosynthesis/type III secretory pathway chaperone